MWQRIVLFSAAIGAVLPCLPLSAETPPPTGAGASCGKLLSKTTWVQLEIHEGRLVAQSRRCGQCRFEESTGSAEPREHLHVSSQPQCVVVSYRFADRDDHISLELCKQGRLVLERQSPAGPAIRYDQPASGPVTLSVTPAGASDPGVKRSAAGLWHLAIAEPELCRKHLLPLLDEICPGYRIDEQLHAVEAAVRAQAGSDVLLRRQQFEAWIDQLTSETYAERQAADLALRGAGQSALAFLRQLDLSRLDGEQRLRVRKIVVDLQVAGPDTPARVAGWLADDKQVWLALLSRGNLDQRIAAADHLAKLCRRSLAYDPQASDTLRQAQLAQLREMLAEK